MTNIEFGMDSYLPNHSMPKKHRLGPQNGSGSLGLENCQKIVNCATIKETGKLKVGVQEEQVGGHQYPPGSEEEVEKKEYKDAMIEEDIGGHPPIPLRPTPLFLLFFQFP